ELALAVAQDLPHLRMPCDDRDDAVDARPPDRRGHLRARDEDAAAFVELDRVLRGEPGEAVGLVERDALADGEPGDGAIHGSGVEVAELELLREPPRDGALARPGRTVDGDYHVINSARTATRSSA